MDKYYRACPEELRVKAGFIKESFDSSTLLNLNSLTTPIPPKSTGSKLAVIISTGSFAPCHLGHIYMMKQAKDELITMGYDVVAGYLSPSHDHYVKSKLGKDFLDLPTRIQKIEEIIEPWMFIDLFESLLPSSCNFTTVIERLDKFLELHYSKVEVFYVYGSDNESFGHAFTQYGKGICIEREGYPFSLDLPRVINCKKTIHSMESSTKIRKPKYYIRQDNVLPLDVNPAEYEVFSKGFVSLISSLGFSPEIIITPSKVESKYPQISLDLFYKGDYSFGVSREFNLSNQKTPQKLIARPGGPNLYDQAKLIPKGEYSLIDDDKSTGNTVKLVKQILNHCTIKEEIFLIDSSKAHDVIDLRDFIWGARNGGLVLNIKDETVRIPYFFPWVNQVYRMRIKPEQVLEFNKKLWQLNYDLFKNYPNLKIKSMEPAQVRFFELQGISLEKSVLEFIEENK